jgi:AMMECR1 domain-containing protein
MVTRNRVEELVQRDELRALHVPVRVLGPIEQIDGIGETRVQQRDHVGPHGL